MLEIGGSSIQLSLKCGANARERSVGRPRKYEQKQRHTFEDAHDDLLCHSNALH